MKQRNKWQELCDRTQILKQLFANSNWIPFPSEHLKPFVTQNSMNLIKQQLLRHKENIRKAIKRNDYEIINRKMTELIQLYRVLADKLIKDCINECINIVSIEWNEKSNKVMRILETSTKSRCLDEFINDLIWYSQLLEESKDCERFQINIRNAICGKMDENEIEMKTEINGIDIEESEFSIEMVGADLLRNSLNEAFNYLLKSCVLESDSKIYFQKAQAMCKQFGNEFEKLFIKKIDELLNEVNSIENKTKEIIEDNKDFEELFENLSQIGNLEALESEFDGKLSASNINKNLEEYLMKHLTKRVELIEALFIIPDANAMAQVNNSSLQVKSDKEIEQCQDALHCLQQCGKIFVIPTIGVRKDMESCINDLYKKRWKLSQTIFECLQIM